MSFGKDEITRCPKCFIEGKESPLLIELGGTGRIFCYLNLHMWTQKEWVKEYGKEID